MSATAEAAAFSAAGSAESVAVAFNFRMLFQLFCIVELAPIDLILNL